MLDPSDFPDRDSFIRHLVGVCGWDRAKIARFFDLTKRHVQRLTTADKMDHFAPLPDQTSTMTQDEIESMLRDYAQDPYTSESEREAAWTYLKQGCPKKSK